MTTAVEVRLHIAPEADARIRQLGMKQEFEQMLEHTRQTIPDLQLIEVSVADDPEIDPTGSRVIITAWQNNPQIDSAAREAWNYWQFEQFSPDVYRWFSFDVPCWRHCEG